MLPKTRRIQRKEYSTLLSRAEKFNSPHLVLSVCQGGPSPGRFSFSISKKVLKSAVGRNKWRRRGYSVIQKNLSGVKPGYYCFFSFKKNLQNIKFSDLEKEIIQLLNTAGVL